MEEAEAALITTALVLVQEAQAAEAVLEIQTLTTVLLQLKTILQVGQVMETQEETLVLEIVQVAEAEVVLNPVIMITEHKILVPLVMVETVMTLHH